MDQLEFPGSPCPLSDLPSMSEESSPVRKLGIQ